MVVILYVTHRVLQATRPPLPGGDTMGNNATEEEEKPLPRNFTTKQLAYFDGTIDEKSGENKPVYLSVNGTVFDVSDGRNFYGPDGEFDCCCPV